MNNHINRTYPHLSGLSGVNDAKKMLYIKPIKESDMRTIKFRAYTGTEMVYDNQDKIVKPSHLRSVDDKYFSKPRVYHNLTQIWFYESRLPHATNEHFDHITYVPQLAVMQFTGLTDKNGKEIYEGDIIRHDVPMGGFWGNVANEQVGFVKWDNELCGFIIERIKQVGVPDISLNSKFKKEVLGNIFENAELLNQ